MPCPRRHGKGHPVFTPPSAAPVPARGPRLAQRAPGRARATTVAATRAARGWSGAGMKKARRRRASRGTATGIRNQRCMAL